jgi:hypothetical protein
MNTTDIKDEQERLKSICAGVRRGLPRDVPEQLSERLEELLRAIRQLDQRVQGQAPATQ